MLNQMRLNMTNHSSVKELFFEDFSCMKFSYIDNKTDVERNYDKFFQEIKLLIERHVPVKECSRKELKFNLKPWTSYRIQRMMTIRGQMESIKH